MSRQLNRARKALDAARQTASQWHATAATREAEASDLERRIGTDVLEAGEDAERLEGELATKLAELKAKAATARQTAEAADHKIPEARGALLRAAAEVMTERAKEARREHKEHKAKVDGLLGQLSDLEGGATYVPWEPPRPELGATATYTVTHPRSQVLDRQAAKLEERAKEVAELATKQLSYPDHVIADVLAEADPKGPEAEAKRTQLRQERDRRWDESRAKRLRDRRRYELVQARKRAGVTDERDDDEVADDKAFTAAYVSALEATIGEKAARQEAADVLSSIHKGADETAEQAVSHLDAKLAEV